MSKHQIVSEIHKTARKNFTRCSVILKGIDDLWQADLIDLKRFKKTNNGFTFVLIVMDCFSKFAWVVPVKTKTKSEIATAFINIITLSRRQPINLQTDHGTEFYNDVFQKVTKRYHINHYSTYSIMKASLVERLIRTIKNKLFKLFSLNGNYRWYGKPLKDEINIYNQSRHRTTKFKPNEVNGSNAHLVMNNIKLAQVKSKKQDKIKFKLGDFVRISKYKSIFEKGYTPNWSTEIFKINKIKNTHPVTYQIEDLRNQVILGSFYNYELQKTKYPDTFLIEKILKKKGEMLFVKWLGLSEAENSWIDKKALVS